MFNVPDYTATCATGRDPSAARHARMAAGATAWGFGAAAASARAGQVARDASHRCGRRTAAEPWL